MSLKLVVFDWDGTLMDSTGAISLCIRRACQDLHLPDPGASIASYVIGLGLSDAISYAVPEATAEQVQQLVDLYRKHYQLLGHRLVLFDDTLSVIQELTQTGCLMAIATGKSRLGLNRAFEQTDLTGVFHASRCADECFPKPHPQMLHELLEELGVAPDQALMVGDTSHDIKMARSADVRCVGLTTGAHRFETLYQSNPEHIFSSLTAMMPWLRQQLELESM